MNVDWFREFTGTILAYDWFRLPDTCNDLDNFIYDLLQMPWSGVEKHTDVDVALDAGCRFLMVCERQSCTCEAQKGNAQIVARLALRKHRCSYANQRQTQYLIDNTTYS